jgi:hypothetical protein
MLPLSYFPSIAFPIILYHSIAAQTTMTQSPHEYSNDALFTPLWPTFHFLTLSSTVPPHPTDLGLTCNKKIWLNCLRADWYSVIFSVYPLLNPLLSCLRCRPILKAPYLKVIIRMSDAKLTIHMGCRSTGRGLSLCVTH